jgi:hypothetical protein
VNAVGRQPKNYSENAFYERRNPAAKAVSGGLSQALLLQEIKDMTLDVVAYCPHLFNRQSFRIAEWPIGAAEAGEKLGVLREFFGEFLGFGVAKVDAYLLHHEPHFRVDALARVCADGYGVRLRRIGESIEECGGHLGASGVVNAGEDYLKHAFSYDQQPGAQQGKAVLMTASALGLMA